MVVTTKTAAAIGRVLGLPPHSGNEMKRYLTTIMFISERVKSVTVEISDYVLDIISPLCACSEIIIVT